MPTLMTASPIAAGGGVEPARAVSSSRRMPTAPAERFPLQPLEGGRHVPGIARRGFEEALEKAEPREGVALALQLLPELPDLLAPPPRRLERSDESLQRFHERCDSLGRDARLGGRGLGARPARRGWRGVVVGRYRRGSGGRDWRHGLRYGRPAWGLRRDAGQSRVLDRGGRLGRRCFRRG